ncbi:MAG: hypothetical protein LBH90_00275 [Tannerella sp.]|jgi:uncharacterized protein (TIGR00661 family)|nr:hypothetical protein [Tannerella sp.]
MKEKLRFLFIVQGEGRGHLTQAISLAGILRRHNHEIVEVLVGKGRSREIPAFFSEKMNTSLLSYDAPCFVFKKNKKHLDMLKTLLYNMTPQRIKRYGDSIELIYKRIRMHKPDIVVNFYELLPGLTHLRFRIDVPFINIGHQYLMRHPEYAHGKGEGQHMMALRLHTLLSSIGATRILALSFYPMKHYPNERIAVVPPLLRKEVLDLTPSTGDYMLGYMLNQGYENEVRAWHDQHPEVKLHFFWDKKDAPKALHVDETFTLHKIDDELFIKYMADCRGYITTAGFESVCEALYLNKPVMMIPAHIEQEINAADAASIHGGITGNSFDLSRLFDYMHTERTFAETAFQEWVRSAEKVFIEQITSVATC